MGDSAPPSVPLDAADGPPRETSGWGWGTWRNSAFTVLSNLQKVAVEAADDISKNASAAAKDAAKGVPELQQSMTESLKLDTDDSIVEDKAADEPAEIMESESRRDELQKAALEKLEGAGQDSAFGHALAAAKDAAKGVAELQQSMAESLKLDTEDSIVEGKAADESAEITESESPQDELRKASLEKLEGAGQDSAFGHGLKVIDSSVENLATGAWQAFGTALKGGVNFIQKIEQSAENLAETFQKQGSFSYKAGNLAPGLIEGGKAITAKGLEVLEYVGKEAIDLIATEAGIEIEEDPKQSDREVIEEDEQFIDDATFDRCFYIYGGPEQLEELEALSNHHMLLWNRAKAKLSSEQKSSFDAVLKQLQQILDLGVDTTGKVLELDKGKRVDAHSQGDLNEMKVLREASVAKAAEMAAGFTVTLGGLAMSEVVQKTTDRLEAIRVEGVHRLSELCASVISQLLNLGKSVLASNSNQEDGSTDHVAWPQDCVEKAKLIRAQAQAMADDIEAVSYGFITGIADVSAAFQAAIRKDGDRDDAKHELIRESTVEEKAHALTSDLENDGSTAIEKLQFGLKQLVYVVLATTLKN